MHFYSTNLITIFRLININTVCQPAPTPVPTSFTGIVTIEVMDTRFSLNGKISRPITLNNTNKIQISFIMEIFVAINSLFWSLVAYAI